MSFTPPEPDRVRLQHMLDAALEAQFFAAGQTQEDIAQNRMLALSVVKCIEIVGEAAARISPETQSQIDRIPWRAIVAMRNRLIHGYFDIDVERVWNTVVTDLPPLIEDLRQVLKGAS